MTIVEFLTARWDEAEQRARDATPGPWTPKPAEGSPYWNVVDDLNRCVAAGEPGACVRRDAAHIAANNPPAVLTDLTAKRIILARYLELQQRHAQMADREPADGYTRATRAGYIHALEIVLRDLATAHASHPDYQDWPNTTRYTVPAEEWTP
ncbi:DUF6221 family protein [Spirillospora sp. NPDC127200]